MALGLTRDGLGRLGIVMLWMRFIVRCDTA